MRIITVKSTPENWKHVVIPANFQIACQLFLFIKILCCCCRKRKPVGC